jgi:nicotinamide-nucleotide amidase
MNAAIISIGDELLIGQVVNSNASYVAEQLNLAGVTVKYILTVGDNEDDILETFRKYFSGHDLVLVTGGLGPTHDDVTRSAVCQFFNTKLVVNEEVKANVKRVLSLRNLKWTPAAENQTLVPEGCKIIPNKHGTAAGLLFERENKFFVVMPGVPFEMKSMMDDYLISFFKDLNKNSVIIHRSLNTTGIAESTLSDLLGDLGQLTSGAKLAFLPSPTGVKLRISVNTIDNSVAQNIIEKIEFKIREKADDYIYGTDNELLEEVIGKLLIKNKLSISVAESCTGGLIANRITNIPGSSQYFERGVVTYSNKSKVALLNVSEDLINKYGAVSKQVAESMAEGIRNTSKTDIGLSSTGVAGPTGATPEKPVGLVWIGYSDGKQTVAEKYFFGDDRIRVKIRASQAALDIVRRQLLQI